jgi:hypothetical protein
MFTSAKPSTGRNMNLSRLGLRQLKATALGMLLLSFISWVPLANAETNVRASVDRNQISSEETFILSLVADSILFSGEPDVSALEKDFHIINRQQSSRTNIINGEVNSSRQWDYTLAPKREGNLTIPAIPMGKHQTRALTLTVTKASQQSRGSNGDSVYLESDVTPRSAYVQAELEYTVKIFTSINFLDASLEAPEVDNAIVEATGEQRYQSLVDGRYYQVIERRYSIYPQTSGDLTIPALTLQARVEGYRPSMLDPGRLVVKRSQEHRLKIMPPPKDFSGAVWLPAKALALTESWSKDPEHIQIGDSITRNVDIQAKGLLGSQLPALPTYTIAKAKLYTDQAKIEKGDEQSEWSGIRSESIAIIPTTAGEIILPEVRIPWWNTRTNKAEVAVLPERRIVVSPGLVNDADSNALPRNSENIMQSDGSTTILATPEQSHSPSTSLLWIIIASLCISNFGFALAWYKRSSNKESQHRGPSSPIVNRSEAVAFNKLKKSIQAGADTQCLRADLVHWGQCYYQQALSLSQIGSRCDELKPYCQALDAQLFGERGEAIDSNELLEAVKRQRATSTSKAPSQALAPLYSS